MDKTLAKGLRLLEEITRTDSAGVSELAARLQLTKSNVHRLLQTLVACGYVQQQPDGRYAATLRAWEAGYQAWTRSAISKAASPFASHLARRSGLLVHLTVADGSDLLFVEQMGQPTPHPIHGFWPVGGRLHCSEFLAGGHDLIAIQIALLAFLPRATLKKAITSLGERRLPSEQLSDIQDRIDAARRSGYALNRGEWFSDMRGAAAPFFHADSSVAGVLGFNAVADQLSGKDLDQWAAATKSSAGAITQALAAAGAR